MTQTTSPSTPGVPVPTSSVWPPSNPSGTVIPFPLPWGQTGCCPPGGMDALMKCYCDIQQASAFIGQIMIDQINNNPAVVQAIIAAIEKSGSNLPLIGVTSGASAQPGQVGEVIEFQQNLTTLMSQNEQVQVVTMGVLPPGDWDCWGRFTSSNLFNSVNFWLNPLPPGFFTELQGVFATPDLDIITVDTGQVPALTSAPSLINFSIITNVPANAAYSLLFSARRRR